MLHQRVGPARARSSSPAHLHNAADRSAFLRHGQPPTPATLASARAEEAEADPGHRWTPDVGRRASGTTATARPHLEEAVEPGAGSPSRRLRQWEIQSPRAADRESDEVPSTG